MDSNKLPDCMMPDGGDACAGYHDVCVERDRYRQAIIDFLYANDGCTLNLEPLMNSNRH